MTECGDIRKMIPAHVDGALSPGEERLVREHLASCPECSRVFADLKRTRELVGGLAEVEPPPWLAQKIMAHVKDEAQKEAGIFKRLFYPLRVKVPLQTVAAMLIAGLVLYVYKEIEPPFEAPRAPVVTGQPAAQPSGALPAANVPSAAKTHHEAAAPAPAPAEQEGVSARPQEENTLLLRSVKKNEAEKEASSPSGPGEAQKAGTYAASSGIRRAAKAPTPVKVTLKVADVESAAGEVEELLRGQGARNIRRESREGQESVTGELEREKVGGLVEKLDDVGDAEPKWPALPPGDIAISIDMVPAGPAR